MKCFDKDLCEKLALLGCIKTTILPDKGNLIELVFDFNLYDFIAPTEQARENCKKVFKFNDDYKIRIMVFTLVSCNSEEEAEDLIRREIG